MVTEDNGAGYGEDLRPAPLPPIYVLLQYGLWAHPTEPRDRSTDVTDDEVSKLL